MNRLHSQRIQRLLICQFSLLSLVIFASDLNSNCLILIQFCHDIFDACVSDGQTDVSAAADDATSGDASSDEGASDAASEDCPPRDVGFYVGGCFLPRWLQLAKLFGLLFDLDWCEAYG